MSTELSHDTGLRIADCFAELQDPRQPINQVHLFHDLLVISLCAIVCGADDWEAVADYAAAKAAWLRSFLALPGVCRRMTPSGGSFDIWTPNSSSAAL